MSATATTLMFAIGLLRKEQNGVLLCRDYEPVVRELVARIINTGI